jgi:hypothetical protein
MAAIASWSHVIMVISGSPRAYRDRGSFMKRRIAKARLLAPAGLTVLLMSVAAGCLIAGGSSRKDGPVPAGLGEAVRAAWMGLGNTGSRCGEFDYFPGGGMRNFYCHLLNFMDYKKFADLAGVQVFISGPHTAETLVLDSPYSFGRYNPAFIARLREILIPGASDRTFRAATQGVYDGSIRPLARVFFVTYRKLMNNQDFLIREEKNYLKALRTRTLEAYHYEKYFSFLNCEYPFGGKNLSDFQGPGYDGLCDGNVVKTCVAFWIRRSIDGTAGEFYAGLEKLLEAYDGEFLKKFAAHQGNRGNSAETVN